MKIIKFLVLILLLSVKLFAGSVTATYSAGVIPTTNNTSVTTSSRAVEPGLLTVTIPVGAIIASVSVVYSITATNPGFINDQRSFILCSSTGGTTESAVYSGVGNNPGTYAYSRTGLTIANNVIGGGDIQFALHAFRIFGGSLSSSDTIYNKVVNNSWQITVNYGMPPAPPSNLITTAYTTQIKLSWTNNAANNNVIIAYNTTNTFGTPTNGVSYSVNNKISGGGTVLFNGPSTSCYHIGLNPGTPFFYQMWSVDGSNNYSSDVAGNTTTSSLPVVSNVTFINNISTTGFVDIYYDVTDAVQNQFTISMEVSNDGGTTYNFACTQVTGDIGTGISKGTGKHIIWNFVREHSGESGTNFKIKIIADNNLGDQIYYADKIYNTVTIGTQIWLQENLNVGTMINSASEADSMRNNGIIEKYCYDNDTTNCTTYGGLYQWNEAMQYITTAGAQGICPAGWHIPTDVEFATLSTTVGGDGNALKAIGQGTTAGAGTNASGFSALLAGYRYYNGGTFSTLGSYSYFWRSIEFDASNATNIYLTGSDSSFNVNGSSKEDGFSVRCLKN
jgi:uncharacterized protein (TIGR02145 family)